MNRRPWFTVTVVLDEDQDLNVAADIIDAAVIKLRSVYLDRVDIAVTSRGGDR